MESDHRDMKLKSLIHNKTTLSLSSSTQMCDGNYAAGKFASTSECLVLTLSIQKSRCSPWIQTATHPETPDSHLERCISDNWMRGSNSYLKRTHLVAPSKKVTITICPNQPLFTPWYCQWESASIDGSLCLIFNQRWDFPWAAVHKGFFFFLCVQALSVGSTQPIPLN